MPPVTAKFQADFSDFEKGVQRTEAQLKDFGTAATAAGAKLALVPKAASDGVGPVNSLRDSFRQFDGALAAMGLNIGPQIRGLEDMANASGKGAEGMGLLAKAGLAVGVAMAGWQFGRAIAGWLDLDAKIGNATAKLLGFGDVAAQTAGAVQDTINKAIADGADKNITYAEAIKFNIRHLKEFQEGNKGGWALNAYIAQLEKTTVQVDNLDTHQKRLIDRGLALKISNADIAKGLGISTDAVDTYVAALAASAEATKKAATDAKELADANAKLGKAWKDLYADMKAFGSKQIQELTVVVQKEMATQREAVSAAQTDLLGMMNASNAAKRTAALGGAQSLDAQLESLAQTHQANLMKIEQAGRAASSQGGTQWLEHTRTLTDDANSAFQTAWDGIVQGGNAAMTSVNSAVATVGPAAASAAGQMESGFSMAFASILGNAASTADRVALLLKDAATNITRGSLQPGGLSATLAWEQQQQAMRLSNKLPGFASGGPVTRDGPIFAHAGEFVLPKGGSGATINVGGISIVTSGATAANDGRAAADALLTRLKQAGVRV
jgi:hypothetical protein